jgi:nucleotide-binding universal stress UspA family protein
VRPLLAVAETYRPIRRALIAYSGSRESAKTMRRFAQINAWPDVETEVAVFDHPPEKAQALLDAAIEYCRDHGFEAQGRCLPGSARDGLLPHAAECDADLIVMGYSTRTRFSKILVGETGLRVLRDTDRAVFLSQ